MRPGRVAAAAVALGAVAALAGCGTAVAPPLGVAAGPSSAAGPADVVMVLRHAEKPEDGNGDSDGTVGVDASGREDDHSLTATGWERAHRLVDLFDPASGAPRPGLSRPATIYAAGATDEGTGQRTRETVAPLAERLGLTPDTTYGKGEEDDLVERVLSGPGPALISWQHGEIPDIAEELGSVTPAPPREWPDDRFDVVWTFTRTADGWRFAQTPELALPGDRPDPIEG